MIHYDLTPQERTQIDRRWHGQRAPLCGTGDGHYVGFNPADWTGRAPLAKIDCPRCCDLKDRVAPRERSKVLWS